MRLLPAHLAFIFVAKEYLNSAESKKRLCCFRPRWKGCRSPHKESSAHADFLLPRIPRVTYQRLLVGTCFYYFSSLKGVRFDRISLCKGPCCSSLSLSKSGSCAVAVLKELRPPRLLELQRMSVRARRDWCTSPRRTTTSEKASG